MAARNIHLPVWLGSANRPQASTFAVLFALVVLCRALLITVIPLEAYLTLESAQAVSVLYFGVSFAGLLGNLSVPWLALRLRRRWVFTLGCLLSIAAALLIGSQTLAGLILGMIAQVLSIACLDVTLNLYVMDHIPRKELGRFEPVRVFFAAGAFSLGPWLGVFLKTNLAHWAPFAASIAAAVLVLGYFWFLRLADDPAVRPMKKAPANPVRYLPRFFGQPRLRLSWLLAVGRSGWWSMYFVYAPIYAVSVGFSEAFGGAIVSMATATMFLVPLWGWAGRRFGLRRLLIVGYGLSALATLGVAFGSGLPWLGAALLVLAGFATGLIDGAGNLPFMRAGASPRAPGDDRRVHDLSGHGADGAAGRLRPAAAGLRSARRVSCRWRGHDLYGRIVTSHSPTSLIAAADPGQCRIRTRLSPQGGLPCPRNHSPRRLRRPRRSSKHCTVRVAKTLMPGSGMPIGRRSCGRPRC